MMQLPDRGEEYCFQMHTVNCIPFINFAQSLEVLPWKCNLEDRI